ncbi:MAG: hypothetical protein HY314_17435 [Acidobacteria bacterium]|nr:hypothetical protein [Acidobacteriota bacterium]
MQPHTSDYNSTLSIAASSDGQSRTLWPIQAENDAISASRGDMKKFYSVVHKRVQDVRRGSTLSISGDPPEMDKVEYK